MPQVETVVLDFVVTRLAENLVHRFVNVEQVLLLHIDSPVPIRTQKVEAIDKEDLIVEPDVLVVADMIEEVVLS